MSDHSVHDSAVRKPLRVALVGWGAIGQYVGSLLEDAAIQIVAVGVRDVTVARSAIPHGAIVVDDPAQLVDVQPDLVAEAAGRGSVAPWGRAALTMGADLIVSSVSAFADPALLEELSLLARANSAQVHIQPGALGGVDALAAARLMGIDAVEHRIIKPPRAWNETPADDLCDLGSLTEPTTFFSANASETARAFPKNANVAMTTALAGIGPDKTMVRLIADPTATTNTHKITASGSFGNLDVTIANNPLPNNPKTSAMAALNLTRAIQNRVATIQL